MLTLNEIFNESHALGHSRTILESIIVFELPSAFMDRLAVEVKIRLLFKYLRHTRIENELREMNTEDQWFQ